MAKDMISVIVPCYNEEEALPYFLKEIERVMAGMPEQDFELILVNDGSKDGTKDIILKAAEADSRIRYIFFSRNFGKEAAIYAGLEHAGGDYVVMMDADLQDPPSLLPEMYAYAAGGEYDSVATRRINRAGEPPVRSWFAHRFYNMMKKIADTDMVDGERDYRLMNRKFVNALLKMREYNRFSKGMFGWVGFRTKWIEFENTERVAGRTKWSFWSLVKYSIEGITAFSTKPLMIASMTGLFFTVFSVIFIIFIIVRKLIFGDPVAGWPSLVCIIAFFGGLQLFALGIVGEYIAKMYLEIKKRPIYLIDEDNFGDAEKKSKIKSGEEDSEENEETGSA